MIPLPHLKQYELWRKAVTDPILSQELGEISSKPEEIQDRFYRWLSFGTGGLRGILGVGTNRMNLHTVQKATQGLAQYLCNKSDTPSVVIGYDSRINSTLFAQTVAEVMAGNGVKSYLFDFLMPTPVVSFGVRALGCTGGVMITASHNPAPYNGYKVYGADGCQITTQAANEISSEMERVDPFAQVKTMEISLARKEGLVAEVPPQVMEDYFSAMEETSVLAKETPRDLSIVYSPLCGAGISCVPQALERAGFSSVILVEEQKNPDGTFPTCPKPNPEEAETLSLGITYAKRHNSDLVIATDPDCDRVGVAVKTESGYQLINGNQMGVLLLHFLATMNQGSNPVAISTIVTTAMADVVAKDLGVELISVLTGFKFIGEQIALLERSGESDRFLLGFEESYGYLSTTAVRDKDGVNGTLLICEMVAHYKNQGKTLVDALETLYQKYGYYREKLLSFEFYGERGFQEMEGFLQQCRTQPPKEIGGLAVVLIQDYLLDWLWASPGEKRKNTLPPSNVLQFQLQGESSLVIRPSGTEPKLKLYLSVRGEEGAQCEEMIAKLERFCREWVEDEQSP